MPPAPPPVPPVPHGRTARRLQWAHLPPVLRRQVERRCGSAVVEAHSQDAGFTTGLASVLVCEDGSRHFLQAASRRAQRTFAAAYDEEARVLAALPASAPAPRLLWSLDDEDWVVLGVEHVGSRSPARPWTADDLDRALGALGDLAALRPAPAALRLDGIGDALASWPGCWQHVRHAHRDLAAAEHLDEAAALAAGFAAACAGDAVVHTEVRADNVLLADDGRTLLCDWAWPVAGAAWVDTVVLLVEARGDGHDADALLAASPLADGVPADHVDALLALVAGYHLKSGDDPVPHISPWLRTHQQHVGATAWSWLAARRGWA